MTAMLEELAAYVVMAFLLVVMPYLIMSLS
jgi:hypothetical protein